MKLMSFCEARAYNAVSAEAYAKRGYMRGKDKKPKMTYKRTMYKRCGYPQRREAAPIRICEKNEEDKCVSYCSETGYPSLATVYSVNQCWRDILDGNEGFCRGTIFCELYKPFKGDKCKNGGCAK